MARRFWSGFLLAGALACAAPGSSTNANNSCRPEQARCDGDGLFTCGPDGTSISTRCDSALGLVCDASARACTGVCSDASLGASYIGCEYYPTITGNSVYKEFDFAVSVSNATSEPAVITIDGGALDKPRIFEVAPRSVGIQKLPWVPLLKACMNQSTSPFKTDCGSIEQPAALVKSGAYRLRSTRPVSAYQFNPLDYWRTKPAMYSYTADASLLLPKNALTGEYISASWPAWLGKDDYLQPGLVAVTATEDGTRVTVTTRAPVAEGNGAPAFVAGVPKTVTLDRGDVLELFAYEGDLTGSLVSADRRVQVISGHYCTQVPIGMPACDHLEESMFPVQTWGRDYVATAPAVPSMPNGKRTVVRVLASRANTKVTFDPPPNGAPPSVVLADVGDTFELMNVTSDLHVTASAPIAVVQYMTAQTAGGDTGDPSMALAIPQEQFRSSYLFHAPLTFKTNYVNVIAPVGVAVDVDGSAIVANEPIGSSGYGVTRLVLGAGNGGYHAASSSAPFGISVYGYGDYTSYWYPGGLDLRTINPR